MAKYHRLVGLNNRNLFSQSSGGQSSKIKLLAGLGSSEASLLGLQMVCLPVFAWSLLCLRLCQEEGLCVRFRAQPKDSILI